MISANVGEIPPEGLIVEGETSEDIFQFAPTEEEVSPAGPVRYQLTLIDGGGDLLVARGKLIAPFTLRCVACLEKFPFTLVLDGYAADFDDPPDGRLDMTERIREDLLLEIPGYPHCDRDGDDPDRRCPAAGKFDPPEDEGTGDSGPSAWDALDQLEDRESP